MTTATADLCDAHPGVVKVCHTPFRHFGQVAAFHGPIRTLSVLDDNALVRQTLERPGHGAVLVVNGIASVLCFGLLALVHPGMPVVLIGIVLYVSGALRSIGFTAYNSLAFSDVDGDDLTHANTLNASVQELAAGLGIAVAALLVSQLASYSATFLVLGAVLAVTLVESLRLPRAAGAHVTGQ